MKVNQRQGQAARHETPTSRRGKNYCWAKTCTKKNLDWSNLDENKLDNQPVAAGNMIQKWQGLIKRGLREACTGATINRLQHWLGTGNGIYNHQPRSLHQLSDKSIPLACPTGAGTSIIIITSDGPGKPRRLVSCWCTIQYKVHNPNDSNHPHLILKTIPTGPCTCLSQSTLYQPLSLSDHYLPWLVDCHVYLDPHLNACSSNQIVVSCNLHYISPCPERASLIHYQYHLLSYLSCPRSILIVPSLFASVLVNTCSSNQIVVSCNHVLFVVLV